MKTILVSDVSLKQIAKRREEMPLCDRKKLAATLSSLGVDAIELPPMKDPREDVIIDRIIAAQAQGCEVRIPVGYTESSLADAASVAAECPRACLQVEYPLSTVQLEYMFHQKAAQAIETISALIAAAKEKCDRVELILGDVTRADRELIAQVCALASEKGATDLTLCDDTEAVLPAEMAELVAFVRPMWQGNLYVRACDKVGMGAAVAMAAIEAGADGVKTSIRGEDALPLGGFANLVHVRGESLGFVTGLNVTAAGQTVSNLLNKDTVLISHSEQTESEIGITLDASSTLAQVADATQALGYELSEEDCGKVRDELIRVAAKKGRIGERELEAIIAGAAMAVPSTYHIETYVINSGNTISSTAQIALTKNGERLSGVSIGDGPIDAAFRAIEQIIGHHYELEDFGIRSVTQGREALGSALVKLRAKGRLYSGNGVSTDIVGAAIRAYVSALNKIVYEEN